MRKSETNFEKFNSKANINQIFIHSEHSRSRAAQRGIRNPWIEKVIIEGQLIYKQGLKFHFMTEKELRFQAPSMQDKLKNLVVVMAGDDNTVITCYKNGDAIGNIKRKSKRLRKNNWNRAGELH
jgi:hypothetical protein